jgi:hypothetical protein
VEEMAEHIAQTRGPSSKGKSKKKKKK